MSKILEEHKKNQKIHKLGDKIVRGIATKEEKDTYKTLVSPQSQEYKNKINKTPKKNCPYCDKKSKTIKGIDIHISTQHQDKWEEYLEDKEIKARIDSMKLDRCEYCGQFIKKLDEHLKKCSKNNIFCSYCDSNNFSNFSMLDKHILEKHRDKWNNNTSKRCNICGLFIEITDVDEHHKNCIKTLNTKEKSISKVELKGTTSSKKIEEEVKSTDSLQNTKLQNDKTLKKENNNKTCSNEVVNEEKIKPKLKEQILKHKSEIEQYDEEINDELLTNEEQYYDDIRKKIEYETRHYKEIDRKKILKQYVYTTKSSAIDTTLRNEIRSYLYKIYRGYCQICGFTFRKPSDSENSFEMHNWDNKLIVRSKKYLVSSADSLCLCRNCSANIKFGAFKPLFVNKMHNLKSKSIDEVKELICNKVSREDIVDRFQEFYEWDDIYALEISLNDKPKNIYMTNGHLIQFIAYLQLEERK